MHSRIKLVFVFVLWLITRPEDNNIGFIDSIVPISVSAIEVLNDLKILLWQNIRDTIPVPVDGQCEAKCFLNHLPNIKISSWDM